MSLPAQQGGIPNLPPGTIPSGGGQTLSLHKILELTHLPEFVNNHDKNHNWNGLAIGGIGLAESGGNTHAQHVNKDGSIDRGWLQINNVAHPDVSDACAYDPVCAVKAAYRIWISAGGAPNDKGYSPWTTYGTQAYKDKVNELLKHGGYTGGVPAIERNPMGSFDSVTSALNPLSWADALGKLLNRIESGQFWLNVGKVIGGIIAIVLGVRYIGAQYVR